ncbi:MAG: lysylphosphatidylglycerol synthase transmembrane domain-containing protein [Kiritimatiellia bacterium]
MRKRIHTLLAAGISIVILTLLYRKLDLAACRALFERMSGWRILSIAGTLVAIDLLTARRWQMMTQSWGALSYIESLRLVLASSALNVVVPSKLGGLAKAYFLKRDGVVTGKAALSMVIYERLLDLAVMSIIFIAVAIWHLGDSPVLKACLAVAIGIMFGFLTLHVVNLPKLRAMNLLRRSPYAGRIVELLDVFYLFHTNRLVSKARLIRIYVTTLLLWLTHAWQIVTLFHLIVPQVPALKVLRNMLCAIFVGFLPVSTAGVGTRDLAIVHLFRNRINYEEAVLVGGLTTLVRYVIPTLIGLPFLLTSASWRATRVET